MTEYRYELIQDGMRVAAVSAPTRVRAVSEIMHYALIYSQDGPVKVREIKPRKKRTHIKEVNK